MQSNNPLINMLSVLLADYIMPDEKKRILTNEYGIPMTAELEEGVDEVCNLGEGIYNRGISQGISLGEILSEIKRMLKKISKGKERSQIILELTEDSDVSEEELNKLYDLVCSNSQFTANEILDIYQRNYCWHGIWNTRH